MATILGLETSCDDTSLAIVEGKPGPQTASPRLLGLATYSQETLLAPWGGVVPEIAARHHVDRLVPLLRQLLEETNLKIQDVDALAVTTIPGLVGPLLTGLSTAKTLSLLFNLPIIAVNHLAAHLEAIHLTRPTPYPFLGLVASGGHGFYALLEGPGQWHILGRTLDDAPGEAFDKGGKLLGIGYPGGKEIDNLAEKARDKKAHSFPIGLASSRNATLSFSGVKTALRLFVEKNPTTLERDLPSVCYAYREAIVGALLTKARFAYKEALKITGQKQLPFVVGGGVASNLRLRTLWPKNFPDTRLVAPRFCTDNGAMIATLGLRTLEKASPFPHSLNLGVEGSCPHLLSAQTPLATP